MIKQEVEKVVREVAQRVTLLAESGEKESIIYCVFDEHLSTLLSQLTYEYPILTSEVPLSEVQRWSVYWCVKPLMFLQEGKQFVFSIELVANKVSLLSIQYNSLEGISVVETDE